MTTSSSEVDPDKTAPEGAENAGGNEAVQDANHQPADSSNAGEQDGAKQPASVLDAVTAALKGAEEKDAGAEQSPGSKDGGKDGEAPNASDAASSEKKEEAAEEEEEDPPFHTHPRWQKMKAQRDEFRSKAQELETKVQELEAVMQQQKDVVDRFNGFTQAVQRAGLTPQEVDTGFEIMRLMKSDPEKAYQMLQPYIDALSEFTGSKLPADLQEKVDKGAMDEDSAREVARLRSRSAWTTKRTQEQQATTAQQEQQRRVQAHVNTVANAITGWETNWEKNDPDYQKKQALVSDRIVALMQAEGYPRDAKAAVAMAERAKKAVEDHLSKMLPQRPAKKPVTGGSSGSGVAPKPNSMLEAVQQGLRAAG
jgi:hypothetical protein